METEAAVCVPRSTDGVIEVYGSMQHPFSTRRFVAACLGVALSEVEVIGTPMGGGFGGKDDTAAIVCARTALAAKLLNRPVKMVYRRDWSMRESYKRHPYRVHYKMGVTKAGRITAVQCRIVADGGAYCSVTPWVTWRSTVQCCGPYVVENVHCDTFGVYTNNVVTGAMRGFGSPQMNFVIEQMVEMAARAGRDFGDRIPPPQHGAPGQRDDHRPETRRPQSRDGRGARHRPARNRTTKRNSRSATHGEGDSTNFTASAWR